jgi:hypothetical protein
MTWQQLAAWLAAGSVVVLAPGSVGARAPQPSGLESRLFLASFGLGGDVDPAYQREYRRLEGLCKPFTAACIATHVRTARDRLAPLRKRPDAAAPVVGHVVAFRHAPKDVATLSIALDVETAETPVRTARWRSEQDLGDWGYGVFVAGVRTAPGWVQLVGLPLVGDAWLPIDAPDFGAHVEPLSGAIVSLPAMTVRRADGTPTRIPNAAYKVTRTDGGVVEFRAEIPTDMPCDDEAKAPVVMPPLLRANLAELFDRDGTPRFFTTYTRGC